MRCRGGGPSSQSGHPVLSLSKLPDIQSLGGREAGMQKGSRDGADRQEESRFK